MEKAICSPPWLNGISSFNCLLVQNLPIMGHLPVAQRYQIQTLCKQGVKPVAIAAFIGKHKSVVSRELRRNCDQRSGEYKAQLAHRKYEQRKGQKPRHMRFTAPVRVYVEEQLAGNYSPEQIAGRARRVGKCISQERIYQHVWQEKKEGGKRYLHLRTQGKRYRKRGAGKDSRGLLVGWVSIEQRPAIVEHKERLGDLEVDLVIGTGHKGALVTINDTASGMVKIRKVESKEAQVVQEAIVAALGEWKPWLHTITSDNGKEFAQHQKIGSELGVDYYFARPYHSWERGANENLNGLIRQYFPKKTCFREITQQQVEQVENQLNLRPRKRYNYKSPVEQQQEIINLKVAFVT